ncbi:hypothetical protein BC831DRAFT_472198, partial [Entophlyctis helioformis]
MSRWILAAASALVGLATYINLKDPVSHYEPLMAQCKTPDLYSLDPSTLPPFHRTGILPLDQFMCVATAFFLDAVSTATGSLFTRLLVPMVGAVFLLAALESTRASARWFAWAYPLVTALSQLLGVGVILPLLWVPSMILGHRNGSSGNSGNSSGGHAPLRVGLVRFVPLVSLTCLLSLAVMAESQAPMDTATFAAMCLFFNVAPVVASCVWIPVHVLLYAVYGPVRSLPHAGRRGSDAAHALYEILGTVSAIYWVYSLYRFLPAGLFDPSTHTDALAATMDVLARFVSEHAGPDNAGYFLLLDLMACWTAFAIWATFEDGLLRGTLTVVVLGLVLGPAQAYSFMPLCASTGSAVWARRPPSASWS